jgi:hypothetical protein
MLAWALVVLDRLDSVELQPNILEAAYRLNETHG